MNAEEFGVTLGKVDACIEEFIAGKRSQVDSFVQNHFSLQETWKLQKKSVALDIVLYPLNTLWSIPYLTIKKSVEVIDKLGWAPITKSLDYIPSGFKTRYQKQTEALITKDFMSSQAANDLVRSLEHSAGISKILSPTELTEIEIKISNLITKEIDNHTSSQILITDLTTSAITLLAGKWMFGDGNISVLGMGRKIARKFANDKASEKFFLGKKAGTVFYKAFPVAPTKSQIYFAAASIGLMLTIFSLAAAVLSDPLRKKLGLHHKKLNTLVNNLEEKIFILVKAELKHSAANFSLKKAS